jgi:peroxiredoxin
MARTPSTMLELGTPAPAFSLPDTVSGRTVALGDFAEAPALLVAFWCNHCPFVKHVESAFVDFAREYADRGLAVVAISSNDVDGYPQDGPGPMKETAAAAGYGFPYLHDATQEVAKAYRAACTPDFFLFDGEHTLVYRGQFDASRPGNDVPVNGADMRAAVEAVLGGRAVPEPQIPSLGCNIKWTPGNEPDYYG